MLLLLQPTRLVDGPDGGAGKSDTRLVCAVQVGALCSANSLYDSRNKTKANGESAPSVLLLLANPMAIYEQFRELISLFGLMRRQDLGAPDLDSDRVAVFKLNLFHLSTTTLHCAIVVSMKLTRNSSHAISQSRNLNQPAQQLAMSRARRQLVSRRNKIQRRRENPGQHSPIVRYMS